jgi:hypothetical protein
MWRKNKGDWDKTLASIDNYYLRVKVACTVWWDSQDEKYNENRDYSKLKTLIDQYRPYFEDGFTEQELAECLHMVGYPKRLAVKRAVPPKGWNHEYYRRLKKKEGKK